MSAGLPSKFKTHQTSGHDLIPIQEDHPAYRPRKLFISRAPAHPHIQKHIRHDLPHNFRHHLLHRSGRFNLLNGHPRPFVGLQTIFAGTPALDLIFFRPATSREAQ